MLELKSRMSKVICTTADVATQRPEEHEQHYERRISFVLPWRVFINHIDSYHAEKLTDILEDRMYVPQPVISGSGSSFGEGEEESGGEEDENSETVQQLAAKPPPEPPRKFDLIGTALDPEHYSREHVRIIPPPKENKQKFISELLNCGFIIYDITQDSSQIEEANWVFNELVYTLEKQQSAKPRTFKTNAICFYFILISSIMTWSLTKRTNGYRHLTEADFKKHRSHPNFMELIDCERNIVKKRPLIEDKLRTIVISKGITYGEGEEDLHYAFKIAWLNEEPLPIVGDGANLIPLLHVRDLAAAVWAVLSKWPATLRYVVAVEKKPTSQKSLIEAISKSLSTGRVQYITEEEALLLNEVTQQVVDTITVNLDIRPDYLLNEASGMRWRSESTFCGNMKSIVEEYRVARNLRPMRLIILGPPASGKSMIARELSEHYKLPYITMKRLIADTISQLNSEIEEMKESKEDINEENEGIEEDEDAQESQDENVGDEAEMEEKENPQELLDEIRNQLEKNNGTLNNALLTKLFVRRLLTKDCQNQGYIIDGYPKELEQAEMLFGRADDSSQDEDNEEEMVDDEKEDASGMGISEELRAAIMPDLVFLLDASDNFLTCRIINLPEREVQNTRYSEKHMIARLNNYRQRNQLDNTPLQVFDELEIHPIIIDVEKDDSPQMLTTYRKCLAMIGPPRNFGLTPDELEEENKRLSEDAARQAAEQERNNATRHKERMRRAAEWTELLELMKIEEEERDILMAEPLRHYLIKHVFPTLTRGLIEVAQVRPDEPIDYIAEYLFKANPEGRAFSPDYNEAMSGMLGSIRQLESEGVIPTSSAGPEAYQLLEVAAEASTEEPAEDRSPLGPCELPPSPIPSFCPGAVEDSCQCSDRYSSIT